MTDHARAEERARLEAARVAAAIDVAELGFSDWTIGGSAFVDARLRDLLGLAADGDDNVQAFWLSRIHPEDAKPLLAEAKSSSRATSVAWPSSTATSTRRAAGFWLRHNSRRYSSPAGAVRLVGAIQDVTDQRSREAALKTALDELHRLREQLQGENMYLRQESQRTFGASRSSAGVPRSARRSRSPNRSPPPMPPCS